MTAWVGWLLAGAGLLAVPPSRTRLDAVSGVANRSVAALALAVTATAAGCLAALGLRAGLPTAAVLCPAVGLGVRWLQRRPGTPESDDGLALVLDLAAAALRSGRPPADALALAAPAGCPATTETLLQVVGLSRLGADAAQAWAAVPRTGPLGEVAGVAVRSASSGIKLAAGFERLATQLRAERRAAAAVRAHKAGVRAMGPLAACFLPSFVCLGVIPVIVGVAKNAFGVLP